MIEGRKERTVATIEARMTSSRLPGKVLMPIGGMPALEMLIRRLKKSKYLDGICVATTTNTADDPVCALAAELGVEYFRGSESDVLGRVLDAARKCQADLIAEITGDCPFTDPALVDRGVEEFFSGKYDYASNDNPPSYPMGFAVEVFPTRVLEEVERRTNDPVDRTHVSYYLPSHPEMYRCKNWTAPAESNEPKFRVTLDELKDYEAMTVIAEGLRNKGLDFTVADVVSYMRAHPEVVAINEGVRQKDIHEL